MGHLAPTEKATTTTTAGTSTTDDTHDVTANEPEHVNTPIPASRYKRNLNKMKRQSLTAVFNYSNVILTSDMNELLNLGLKFAILPLKLDITQVLVDFKRYKRSLVWKEFFGANNDEDFSPPIFKTKKTNYPKNHNTPKGLNTFLGAIESEIRDPKNRNKAFCNIPKEQVIALKELIKLQQERKIVIKRCDKGAGIIILNFEDYVNACNVHLNSHTLHPDGTIQKYYT